MNDPHPRPPTGRFKRPDDERAGALAPTRRWRLAAPPMERFKPGGPRIRRYRLAALAAREDRPATTPTR